MKRLILALVALAIVLNRLLPRGEGAGRGKTGPQPRSGEAGALSPDAASQVPASITLPVPHFFQENEYSWCYAACGQMILHAYGKFVPQCEIVSGVKQRNCCLNRDHPVCADEGCDHEDIAPIYTCRGITAVRRQPHGRISEAALRGQIAARRPVEVTLESDGSFHAVVIRGFNARFMFVNDPLEEPLPILGFTIKSYDDLVEDKFYTWDETWIGFPPIK